MNISGISDGAKLKSSYKIAVLQLSESEEFLQNSNVTIIRYLQNINCGPVVVVVFGPLIMFGAI